MFVIAFIEPNDLVHVFGLKFKNEHHVIICISLDARVCMGLIVCEVSYKAIVLNACEEWMEICLLMLD